VKTYLQQAFASWGALRFGLTLSAMALVLDQTWKLWFLFGLGWVETVGREPNGLRYEILPFFDIVMVWNHGISYGLLEATNEYGRWGLVLVAIGVTAFLIRWLYSVTDLRLAIAIGLIIGGAVGNVIDRIAYGAVADFFLLHAFGYNWYVFNIADVAVVGGVLLMALDLVVNEYLGKSGDAKREKQ
jgi:signal peptidase II